MFDLDAGKLLVVGVVALVVIGPKDLPRVLRTVGQTVGRMRRMASEFQNQFMEAIKEAEIEDLKKEINAIEQAAKIDTNIDPVAVMREEVTSAVEGAKPVEEVQAIGHSTIDLTQPTPSAALEAPTEPAAEAAQASPDQASPTHDPLAPVRAEMERIEKERDAVAAEAAQGERG